MERGGVVPEICDIRCHPSRGAAYDALAASCSPSDVFGLDNYTGSLDKAELRNSGPIPAVATLLDRNEHFCRASPRDDSDFEYCVIEMWERFQVTDGMHANLNGIEDFIEHTNEKPIGP